MAMGGAMIWPGIGHFIVGRFNRGLFWFTLAIGVLLGGVYVLQNPHWLQVMIVLIPLGIIISLAQLFDAARCGRLSPFGLLREPALRFLVGGILAVLAVAFHHSALTFLQDNVYELCYTPTPSMSPSVSPGDSYLTLKGLPIHRWDIVGLTAPPGVYQAEELAIMKRVVGIPGEKVEITPKGLFINDKPVALPPDVGPYYAVDLWDRRLTHADKTIAGNGCWGRPIYLGPDEYYLLGDNSAESGDARMWPSIKGRQPGAITGNEITCTIVAICWPPERWRLFPE
jgi:signal peptidase I